MSAGKGSRPRPVDGDRYRKEFERIFRKKKAIKATLTLADVGPLELRYTIRRKEKG